MWSFDMNMLSVPLSLLWQRGIVDSHLSPGPSPQDGAGGEKKKKDRKHQNAGFHEVMEDLLRDF